MGVYFFYGDEDYLIDKELKKYRDKLDVNFSAMNFTVYDKLTFPELIAVVRTQPMMFGKMMIVINTRKLVSVGMKRESLLSTSLEDEQLKDLEDALEGNIQNNNEMLDIFFVEKYEKDDKTKKPDTRRKIYKILSKYNLKKFESIPTYKIQELMAVINNMAKERGIKVQPDAANSLIESKGNNLREYETELDKLQLLAYPETTITKEMVKEICESNEDIFNLTDYISTGKFGKALVELRRLLETNVPLKILSTLQTMLKKWIYIKLNANKKSYEEIGARIVMNPYAVKKTLEKIKNIKLKTLVDMRRNITEAEYRIKTGQVENQEAELENAIIR